MSNSDERAALTRELQDRSHDMDDGRPIPFEAVKRSARTIRRRRRIASGVVAAAVVVVGVPIGVTLGNGATNSERPVAPSTSGVTPTESPGVTALTTAGVKRGVEPVNGYVEGSTLHEMGGGTVQLPASYADITPYDGGLLASEQSEGGEYSVVHLGSGGATVREPGGYRFAISADQTSAAYFVLGEAGLPGVVRSGGASEMSTDEATQTIPAGTQVEPIGYVRAGLVYQTDGVQPKVLVTNFNDPPTELEGLLGASGVNQDNDVVSGQLSSSNDGSCWAVVTVTTGDRLWKTCDFSLGKFSGDGRYVIGTDAYGDGLGAAGVAILDAKTGDVVQRFQRPQRSDLFVRDVVWENGGRADLLAIVHENGAWQILRLAAAGAVEAASRSVSGADTDAPFIFATTP